MKVSSIRWGVIWMGIGFIFLAINFQVLDSLVFPRLFSLWPILLVAIGLELIFRKTKFYFLALLSPLLIAAAFIIVVTYGGNYEGGVKEFFRDWSWRYESTKTFDQIITIEDSISKMNLKLELGNTPFNLNSVNSKSLSVNSRYQKKTPDISYDKNGDSIIVDFKYKENSKSSIFGYEKNFTPCEINIPGELPVSINLKTGYSDPVIDFSQFNMIDLSLVFDSKTAVLNIGNRSDQDSIVLTGKVDELTINCPNDLGVEITGHNMAMIEYDSELFQNVHSDTLRSNEYSTSLKNVKIKMDGEIKYIVINRVI